MRQQNQPIPIDLHLPSMGVENGKSKPPFSLKPNTLTGNAAGNTADQLAARFAALKNSTSSAENKILGPREMPIPKVPPKIPINTNLSNIRPPSPAYSPARNLPTPASVEPPRASARSIIGTGGRSNSYAASISSPPPEPRQDSSYFPTITPENPYMRRRGIVGIPTETTITSARLFDFLKLYDILLIDVRSRQNFDEGHIHSNNIICVEPLHLRPRISSSDIETSLSIAPDEEDVLFSSRDKFNLVVFYDQSTSSDTFLKYPKTETEEKLRTLHEALVDYNYEKPLQNSPMLLDGGLDSWIDLLGPPALQTSKTHVGRPIRPRQPSSIPSSLSIGKRRVRQFNPLNPQEEKEWVERARSESVHIPEPENPSNENEDQETHTFYRSEDEFHRRFPEVQINPESMVVAAPRQSMKILQNQSLEYLKRQTSASISHENVAQRPYSQSSASNPYSYGPNSSPTMPIRPVPAAPKVNYSGAHDLNTIPPYNAIRSRYLPPAYISPSDKPCTVALPRVGLKNLGATCYMNSIIQCLNATIPLSRYFRDGSYKRYLQRENWKGSRGVLPDLYATLIHNLWLKTDDPYIPIRPITFRTFCARLNAEWGTNCHQDANDFYIFIMEYLHEDLNIFWRNPPAHVLSKEEEILRERSPMFLAANIEWDRYSKRERSVISDLFAGQHASQLKCLSCRRTSTTYEPWFNLSVEIVGKGKVTLEECLASYCKEERLSKGQEWCCPYCQVTRDATKKIILTKAPPYLVVHLKRFHMDNQGIARKNMMIVDFPLAALDLSPYMLPPPSEHDVKKSGRMFDQSALGPFKYDATAVVEHFGRGLQSGHYISWIHDRARRTWRKFDDDRVTDVKGISPDGAYLIFYERVNTP